MLGSLWENSPLGGGSADADRELARILMDRLDRLGSFILDDETVAGVGAGRRQTCRAVYELVLRERAHVRADSEGRVVVMSNREFNRFLRQRAAISFGTRIHCRAEAPAGEAAEPLPGQAPADWGVETVELSDMNIGSAAESARESGPAAELPQPVSAADADTVALPELPVSTEEYGWFEIDVAPPEAGERAADSEPFALGEPEQNLPSVRQSLPERKREPWVVFEDAVTELAEE